MCSSFLLLFGLVLSAAIILSEAQPQAVKKSITIKKKKAKQFDEYAPDSELGTDCYDACYPNASYLDASGKIKNPKQYGEFTESCGKTYLFGTRKVQNWEENWKMCCSIGMRPIIFDNKDDYECLSKAVTDGKIPLTKDTEFWVGGFQHGLNKFWYWCTKDSPEQINPDLMSQFINTLEERDGEKIRSKYEQYKCARLEFYDEHKTLQMKNFPCDAKDFSFACESVQRHQQDQPDANCKAKCETLNCAVKKTQYKPNTRQERAFKERFKSGQWVPRCQKYFLFSNKTATYKEARKKCCSYGMNLVSLKTAAKRVCLFAISNEYKDIGGDYWTSGSDVDCDGNYRWCSVDRAFLKREVQWGRKQPKSADGDCVWVKMTKHYATTSLYTANCLSKKKFICEARQSGSTLPAIQKECIELLGLTNKEVSFLKNSTYFTYKMKIIAGKFDQFSARRIVYHMFEGNDVSKGDEAINICKDEQDPNDICESAYKFYKCATEKAPVVFRKLVLWEDDPYEEKPVEITGVERQCELAMSTPAGGNNYKDAYLYCGSIKMRLPSANSLEDFKAMYDFMNGSTSDNFYAETQSREGGIERWCNGEELQVPPEISADKFRLMSEASLLVSKKGSEKYTLTPVLKSLLTTSVAVNHFFCEPYPSD